MLDSLPGEFKSPSVWNPDRSINLSLSKTWSGSAPSSPSLTRCQKNLSFPLLGINDSLPQACSSSASSFACLTRCQEIYHSNFCLPDSLSFISSPKSLHTYCDIWYEQCMKLLLLIWWLDYRPDVTFSANLASNIERESTSHLASLSSAQVHCQQKLLSFLKTCGPTLFITFACCVLLNKASRWS